VFELRLKHKLKQRAGNCFSHSCLSGTDLCFSGINELLVHIALIKESMVPSSVKRHLMNPKQKLRVRLFWGKMISGNHFPLNPCVWQQRKMKFSEKSFPVDQQLLLGPRINFTPLFSLQFISGKRERERERKERAQIGERKREKRELIAPLVGRLHCADERRDRRSRSMRSRSVIVR